MLLDRVRALAEITMAGQGCNDRMINRIIIMACFELIIFWGNLDYKYSHHIYERERERERERASEYQK